MQCSAMHAAHKQETTDATTNLSSILPLPTLARFPFSLHKPSLHDECVEEKERDIQHDFDATGDGDVGKWRVDTWHCAIGPDGRVAPKHPVWKEGGTGRQDARGEGGEKQGGKCGWRGWRKVEE